MALYKQALSAWHGTVCLTLSEPCQSSAHPSLTWDTHRDAGALDRIETQGLGEKIKIVDDLIASPKALRDNTGEDLPEVARTVTCETKSIEEHFHATRHLPSVVWGGKDHTVRCFDLRHQEIPIILQRTELFTLFEAQAAAAANTELVIVQDDDFVLYLTKSLYVVQELQDCPISVLLACTSHECCYFLHKTIPFLATPDKTSGYKLARDSIFVSPNTRKQTPAHLF